MSTTKLFEFRDAATTISLLAVKVSDLTGFREGKIIQRAMGMPSNLVVLTHLASVESHSDCYDWTQNRAMMHAHNYIERMWDSMKSGDLINGAKLMALENTGFRTVEVVEQCWESEMGPAPEGYTLHPVQEFLKMVAEEEKLIQGDDDGSEAGDDEGSSGDVEGRVQEDGRNEVDEGEA